MTKYDFLKEKTLPPQLQVALGYVGLTEKPGRGSNPTIMKWAQDLGVSRIYKDDDEPWCGVAHCAIVKESGQQMPYTGYEVLRAASWANYGKEVAGDPQLGDTLVFIRKGGNHVGFYVGHSATTFHVLGGNQSNRYGFIEIPKNRHSNTRRPVYAEGIVYESIYIPAFSPPSKNEA